MSRVGRLPVPIPSGVKCDLQGQHLKVTGPKGSLEAEFRPEVGIAIESETIVVSRSTDKKDQRALHGLTRALINNMINGVTKGFEKTLQIEGVGYRAALQGQSLSIQVGYSHPVVIEPPAGVTFAVDNPTTIRVSGIDKQLVGQVAANVRAVRKPEPYKGKGIRYANERVRRKVGKAGGK